VLRSKLYLLKSSLTKKRSEYECTGTAFNFETCKLFDYLLNKLINVV
jgi:hypothetical protein